MGIESNHKPIIELKQITKTFPGVVALDQVDFKAYCGEVVALVGENGAGKSTLMKIISGVYEPDSGEISIEGEKVESETVKSAQGRGISIIYQEFNLAPNQTVAENIFLGKEPRQKSVAAKFGLVDSKYMYTRSEELLSQVGAHFSSHAIIRDLSVANQQMVEIAKSLSSQSKLIIMDEPTSALGKEEVEVLFNIIRKLKSEGLGIIFITHRLEEVFSVSDRIVVLRDGKNVKNLDVTEANIDKLISLMVGRKLNRSASKDKSFVKEDRVLEVKNLSRAMTLYDLNFYIRSGEILGVAGLIGAGRTEVARVLFGVDKKDIGDIFINGKEVQIQSPCDAVMKGVAFVPENRQIEGLILKQSISCNIALPSIKSLSRRFFINQTAVKKVTADYIKLLNIKTFGHTQKVLNLSGGNQQKVVMAKWLASNPKVLILDEPTRGIDVGAKAEIYRIIKDLASQGIGIMMISSEMPEILMMSDRIMVMYEGKVIKILDRSEASQDKIMAYASGQTD